VVEVFRNGALKCTEPLKEDEALCLLYFESVVSRTSSVKYYETNHKWFHDKTEEEEK
jgi:hypothetical protein